MSEDIVLHSFLLESRLTITPESDGVPRTYFKNIGFLADNLEMLPSVVLH